MSKVLPLREIFLTHSRAAGQAELIPADALLSHLQVVELRARTAWPDLGLPAATFIQHLAERLVLAAGATPGDPTALFQALDRLHAGDLYLACACVHGNKAAAAIFSRDYLGQVAHLIAHMRLPKEELEDIRQSLGERMFVGGAEGRPRLLDYSGQGALLSWIRIAALRRALDRRRQQQHLVPADDRRAGAVAELGDVQEEYLKQRYRQHFEDAMRNALAQLSAEQRSILRLHFLDGLSIDKLGALFKIHRATAARWIAAARRALLLDVRAQLEARLQLTPSEVDSLGKLVRSQLHLSLHRFLGEPSGR